MNHLPEQFECLDFFVIPLENDIKNLVIHINDPQIHIDLIIIRRFVIIFRFKMKKHFSVSTIP